MPGACRQTPSSRISAACACAIRRDFPVLRSLGTRPNNLPQQLTTFIGRDGELAEVKGRLIRNRLVTVAGIGGLGKTRMALQVGAEVLDDFPDGVWFIELAPLADARLVRKRWRRC